MRLSIPQFRKGQSALLAFRYTQIVRCIGRTKRGKRCKNAAKHFFFCKKHRYQPLTLLTTILGVISIYAGVFQDLFKPGFLFIRNRIGTPPVFQPKDPPENPEPIPEVQKMYIAAVINGLANAVKQMAQLQSDPTKVANYPVVSESNEASGNNSGIHIEDLLDVTHSIESFAEAQIGDLYISTSESYSRSSSSNSRVMMHSAYSLPELTEGLLQIVEVEFSDKYAGKTWNISLLKNFQYQRPQDSATPEISVLDELFLVNVSYEDFIQDLRDSGINVSLSYQHIDSDKITATAELAINMENSEELLISKSKVSFMANESPDLYIFHNN